MIRVFLLLVVWTGVMPAAPNASRGAGLASHHCGTSCHAKSAQEQKGMGPNLHGLYKRQTLGNGKPVNEANVRTQVEQGGNGMPAFKNLLSSSEMADILAYLKTI